MINDVEARDAGSKGCGVYARRRFAEGEFIFRRRHLEVVSTDELDDMSEWERMHLCELGFDRFAVLAAPGCFLNHSCEPNAMRHGVNVFAWTPIERDEEITIDYRLNAFDGDSWPCECGAPACTGTVIGSFFAMEPERQELLAPHAPTFIRREYNRRRALDQLRKMDRCELAAKELDPSLVSPTACWTAASEAAIRPRPDKFRRPGLWLCPKGSLPTACT